MALTSDRCWPVLLLALCLTPATAAPIDPNNPPDGLFADDWAELFLDGGKVGYAHSTMSRDGNLIHTVSFTAMRIKRANMAVEISTRQATTETVAGVPVSFDNTQDMATMKTRLRGTIKDGSVTIQSSQYGMKRTQTFDFAGGTLMTWGAFREGLKRGFEPGTQYTLDIYVPDLLLNGPTQTTTTVGKLESFTHRSRTQQGTRVTVAMTTPIGSMEMVSWVDDSGMPLRVTMPMPGLGDLDIITTDQATAMKDFVPRELFMTTTIAANRKIATKSAKTVRILLTPKTAETDLSGIPTTGMQTPHKRTGGAVELVLKRQSYQPMGRAPGTPPKDMGEYLGANLMMNLDDPELIKLAEKAGGSETDPFALGDKLRRFVTRYVETKNLSIGFATASEVCRTKEGDCSEHGVLLAALGRIRGLPSRVAVGLAYVPTFGGKRDIFGYHLWTQFYIDGRWIDYDAALGETECSPTRIAFAVSSLHDAGLADLSLPLLDKIGGIDVEILEIE